MDVSCECNVSYIQERFSPHFFFVKVKDSTRLKVDYTDYLLDESLKGEFVRTVMQDTTLTPEMQSEIIRCGLQALAGEEVAG